jgi:hypothetical protein
MGLGKSLTILGCLLIFLQSALGQSGSNEALLKRCVPDGAMLPKPSLTIPWRDYRLYKTPGADDLFAIDRRTVALIVHQLQHYEAVTLAILNKYPELEHAFRVGLISEKFPLHDSEMVYQLSHLHHFTESTQGLRNLDVRAREVHFFGGSCHMCLRRVLRAVAAEFFRSNRKNLHMVIYLDAVYMKTGVIDRPSRRMENRDYLQDLLRNVWGFQSFREASVTRLVSPGHIHRTYQILDVGHDSSVFVLDSPTTLHESKHFTIEFRKLPADELKAIRR